MCTERLASRWILSGGRSERPTWRRRVPKISVRVPCMLSLIAHKVSNLRPVHISVNAHFAIPLASSCCSAHLNAPYLTRRCDPGKCAARCKTSLVSKLLETDAIAFKPFIVRDQWKIHELRTSIWLHRNKSSIAALPTSVLVEAESARSYTLPHYLPSLPSSVLPRLSSPFSPPSPTPHIPHIPI
jgi:hypothetical protein